MTSHPTTKTLLPGRTYQFHSHYNSTIRLVTLLSVQGNNVRVRAVNGRMAGVEWDADADQLTER
jgi:hypothetical protein